MDDVRGLDAVEEIPGRRHGEQVAVLGGQEDPLLVGLAEGQRASAEGLLDAHADQSGAPGDEDHFGRLGGLGGGRARHAVDALGKGWEMGGGGGGGRGWDEEGGKPAFLAPAFIGMGLQQQRQRGLMPKCHP